jgi:hypothetical protein
MNKKIHKLSLGNLGNLFLFHVLLFRFVFTNAIECPIIIINILLVLNYFKGLKKLVLTKKNHKVGAP